MREASSVPTNRLPGDELFGRQRAHLILRERTLPRWILVDRAGRRFTNGGQLQRPRGDGPPVRHPSATAPIPTCRAGFCFDHEYLLRYGFAGARPGTVPDYLTSAPTVEALADRLGLPASQLGATVERWNDLVAKGHDDDFGRGDSAYDGWSGDRSLLPGPLATIGPLTEPPYYAIEIESGTLGTKGGPRTSVDGEVLSADGVIPGLYAAGNVMAGVTGMVYGGAGGTLGPAIDLRLPGGTPRRRRERPGRLRASPVRSHRWRCASTKRRRRPRTSPSTTAPTPW